MNLVPVRREASNSLMVSVGRSLITREPIPFHILAIFKLVEELKDRKLFDKDLRGILDKDHPLKSEYSASGVKVTAYMNLYHQRMFVEVDPPSSIDTNTSTLVYRVSNLNDSIRIFVRNYEELLQK